MMGKRMMAEPLFYTFRLEDHVLDDHSLRAVDALLDTAFIRRVMAPYYSSIGRPSIDPELMIRMLLVGYLSGNRSERKLCGEVHLNLAHRWFCRLGLDGAVPDHSTFSKNRHSRFRDGDVFRAVFEEVVRRCAEAGLVPSYLGADGSYGTGPFLAWLLAHDLDPHIPVLDRTAQTDGMFTRASFTYVEAENAWRCPSGHTLRYTGHCQVGRSGCAMAPCQA